MHFQISLSFWELRMIRDFLCEADIAGKSLNRLLLLFILKSSKFHRIRPVFGSLFYRLPGLRACNFLNKRPQHRYFSSEICEIFQSTYFEEHCEPLLLYLQVILKVTFILFIMQVVHNGVIQETWHKKKSLTENSSLKEFLYFSTFF